MVAVGEVELRETVQGVESLPKPIVQPNRDSPAREFAFRGFNSNRDRQGVP